MIYSTSAAPLHYFKINDLGAEIFTNNAIWVNVFRWQKQMTSWQSESKLRSVLSLMIRLQSDSQMIVIVDTKPKSKFFYSLNIYN